MLDGLLNVAGAGKALTFVLMFYGVPSVYLGGRCRGHPHHPLGEGGEQGDSSAPLLALGQHSALDAIQENLEDGEHLFAFHDIYTTSSPNRVGSVYGLLQEHLFGYSASGLMEAKCRCGIKLESGWMHATLWSVSHRHLISKHGVERPRLSLEQPRNTPAVTTKVYGIVCAPSCT